MKCFDFAIVLDYEATCYGPEEKSPAGWKSEIVEFPAVLVRLDSGIILAEFHMFVAPTEHDQLSKFCRNFLHLQDRDLTVEDRLDEVMEKFKMWMEEISEMYKFAFYAPKIDLKNTKFNQIGCIATWTDWDIGTQLIRREIFHIFFINP